MIREQETEIRPLSVAKYTESPQALTGVVALSNIQDKCSSSEFTESNRHISARHAKYQCLSGQISVGRVIGASEKQVHSKLEQERLADISIIFKDKILALPIPHLPVNGS